VLTTSGTAVGNLLPAVLEAEHSAVPLILLTADRPAAMRGTGANQTANHVIRLTASFADVAPGDEPGDARPRRVARDEVDLGEERSPVTRWLRG